MFHRKVQAAIEERLFKGKAILITGARQVGKTTLVKALSKKYEVDYLYLNCDEPDVRTVAKLRN
jgi:predicted AAA+ superfamily ATPase